MTIPENIISISREMLALLNADFATFVKVARGESALTFYNFERNSLHQQFVQPLMDEFNIESIWGGNKMRTDYTLRKGAPELTKAQIKKLNKAYRLVYQCGWMKQPELVQRYKDFFAAEVARLELVKALQKK